MMRYMVVFMGRDVHQIKSSMLVGTNNYSKFGPSSTRMGFV